jgi:hypothetical protein
MLDAWLLLLTVLLLDTWLLDEWRLLDELLLLPDDDDAATAILKTFVIETPMSFVAVTITRSLPVKPANGLYVTDANAPFTATSTPFALGGSNTPSCAVNTTLITDVGELEITLNSAVNSLFVFGGV